MMTAAMDMMQVESRINGVNEALTIAGAPFHVSANAPNRILGSEI